MTNWSFCEFFRHHVNRPCVRCATNTLDHIMRKTTDIFFCLRTANKCQTKDISEITVECKELKQICQRLSNKQDVLSGAQIICQKMVFVEGFNALSIQCNVFFLFFDLFFRTKKKPIDNNSTKWMSPKTRSTNIHTLPDTRTGERVPF